MHTRGNHTRRIIQEILLLDERRHLSKLELATRFKTTTKTIERDIKLIQELGVPLWSSMEIVDDISNIGRFIIVYHLDQSWHSAFSAAKRR